jgi:muramoyltetrapeptide carboxypeptidase
MTLESHCFSCGSVNALSNAIYKKTGLVGYSGLNYASFGMLHGLDYSLEYLYKSLVDDGEYEIYPSKSWSDDRWYKKRIKITESL